MKVVLTGASGFIGRHVLHSLINSVNQDNISLTLTSRTPNSLPKSKYYEVLKLDINNPPDNVLNYLGYPDLVIHLAWEGLPNYKGLFHIEKNLCVNYNFLKNLISQGLRNLSVTGTCFEYGMIEGQLSEDITPNPDNPYGIAKDSLRKFIQQLKNEYQFNFKWLRLFYTYGEGQSSNSLFAQLNQAISNKNTEFNMSKGDQIRDFLEVSEMAKLIVECSFQTKVEGVINCCSGFPISVKDFVKEYLKKRGSSLKLNLGYYPYPDYEPFKFWGDTTKLKKAIYE